MNDLITHAGMRRPAVKLRIGLGLSALAAGLAMLILPESLSALLGLTWFVLAILLLLANPD